MNRRQFSRTGLTLALTRSFEGRAQQAATGPITDIPVREPEATHYSWWQRPPVDVRDWPVLIGTESQLFVDDHLIDSRTNVSRQFHQPVKHSTGYVLRPEVPWEGTACMAHGTVIRDSSGTLRMYYEGWTGDVRFEKSSENPRCVYCMATSEDGLYWERPRLDVQSFRGQSGTNIILPYQPAVNYYTQVSVILDATDPNPSRRWKLGVKDGGAGLIVDDPSNPGTGHIGPGPYAGAGYFAWFSADGIRWKKRPEPIMTDGWSIKRENWPLKGVAENQSVLFDPVRKKFVAFVRIWDCRPGRPAIWRSRAVSESDDFLHWTPPRVLFLPLEDDEAGLQFYGSTGFNYESMYLGLLRCYRSASTHQVYFQLVSSRDGVHWVRAGNRQPFIDNGPLGSLDGGYHSDFSNPPIRMGDELWFYYGSTEFGKNVRPYKGGICLARLRLDGFASIDAGERRGTLLTRPLDFARAANTLKLNCKPRRGGNIAVEVLDREGRSIPGFQLAEAIPVHEDSVAAGVSWRGGAALNSLSDRTIRLKFHMVDASIYSFSIRAGANAQ